MRTASNLISVEELASRLDEPNLRIIDCRSELADSGAGRRHYLEGHIPGAVFADLDVDLAAPVMPDTGRHPLPTARAFAKTCRRLGVGNASEVVVYDQDTGALAARAWWMLRWLGHSRVRLLDGGFAGWLRLSHPTVAGAETPAPGDFVARPQPDQVLTTAELVTQPRIATLRLYDARDAARFRGEQEPIDPVAGHIPGSNNLPYSVSLAADGRWKSAAELEELWRGVLGDDKTRPWAVMCGSGVTACHLALSANEVGYTDPRLYVGSWSEWIRDAARPIGRSAP